MIKGLKKVTRKLNNLRLLLKRALSSRQQFQNFLLVYFILQFEWLRKIFIKLYQTRIGKSARLTEIYLPSNLDSKFELLQENGYAILNKTLSDSQIEYIKKQVQQFYCYDNYNKHVGKYKLEEAPPSVNIAGYHSNDLVTIPEVMQLANDPEILALAQEYLGCKPTITTVQMWWSLTGREKPQFAQFYHRDFDGLKFIKLFIYLTDVSENDGPHLYVAGSAKTKKLRRPTRFSDEDIARNFPQDKITKMCGKKGMIFLEDTFGIHKGTVPIHNNRLILQFQYGIHPVIDAQYQSLNLPNALLDPYINRLYIETAR